MGELSDMWVIFQENFLKKKTRCIWQMLNANDGIKMELQDKNTGPFHLVNLISPSCSSTAKNCIHTMPVWFILHQIIIWNHWELWICACSGRPTHGHGFLQLSTGARLQGVRASLEMSPDDFLKVGASHSLLKFGGTWASSLVHKKEWHLPAELRRGPERFSPSVLISQS